MGATCNINLCYVDMTPVNQRGFENVTDQSNWFGGKVVSTYNNVRYTPRDGIIKIKGYVDSINSNYGFYDNTKDGVTKRYYFWVVEKNQKNNGVCVLTIAIDLFQTYMFDMYFKPCFIERETSPDDVFGDNKIIESFEMGNYLHKNVAYTDCLEANMCYMLGVADSDMGGTIGQQYCGYSLYVYKHGDVDSLNAKIRELNNSGKIDSVIFIYQFPQKMLKWIDSNTGIYENSEPSSGSRLNDYYTNLGYAKKRITYTPVNHFDNIVPYNNKLLQYPFNFINMHNSNGDNVQLRIEDFNYCNATAPKTFECDVPLSPDTHAFVTPLEYSGYDKSYADSISTDSFGLGSWVNDTFANWFAQNSAMLNQSKASATAIYNANSTVAQNSANTAGAIASNNYNNATVIAGMDAQTNTVNTGLNIASGVVGSLASGNIGGALQSGVGGVTSLNSIQNSLATSKMSANNARRNSALQVTSDLANTQLLNFTTYQNEIASTMAQVSSASVQPNTCVGSTAGVGIDVNRKTNVVWFDQCQIDSNVAIQIDNYFNMYGYKVNKIATPSIYDSRYNYKYLKTLGCQIYSQKIPQADANVLQDMFDNGIRIWYDDWIGNFGRSPRK